MLSLIKCCISNITTPRRRYHNQKQSKYLNYRPGLVLSNTRTKHLSVFCSRLTPWEPTPLTYAPTDEVDPELLEESPSIFNTLKSEVPTVAPATDPEKLAEETVQPSQDASFLKWPMWVLGPAFLLGTGMVPTLWLPISSIYVGPNIASLLSLVGLDCIFNLGATLFLLMAHSTTRSKDSTRNPKSNPPFSYQFWNIFASIVGFTVPLAAFFGMQRGFFQSQLSHILFLVLFGTYLLLLSVQMLTELLMWHWQSPVWLVTPVVYEAYRVLQLMRGLKLSAEVSAPAFVVHTIRGLVCWWVLILGLQLMRVAWFAGFTARASQERNLAKVVNG